MTMKVRSHDRLWIVECPEHGRVSTRRTSHVAQGDAVNHAGREHRDWNAHVDVERVA